MSGEVGQRAAAFRIVCMRKRSAAQFIGSTYLQYAKVKVPLTGSAQRSSGVLEHVCDGGQFIVVRGIEHAQGKIVPVNLHREIVPGKGY